MFALQKIDNFHQWSVIFNFCTDFFLATSEKNLGEQRKNLREKKVTELGQRDEKEPESERTEKSKGARGSKVRYTLYVKSAVLRSFARLQRGRKPRASTLRRRRSLGQSTAGIIVSTQQRSPWMPWFRSLNETLPLSASSSMRA